jgi:hypothetical protein
MAWTLDENTERILMLVSFLLFMGLNFPPFLFLFLGLLLHRWYVNYQMMAPAMMLLAEQYKNKKRK